MFAQVSVEGHEDACSTETALQGMVAAEGILQRRQTSRFGRKIFDRADMETVDLNRQRQAGSRRDAVDLHGAGAAYAVFATDMRSGEAQLMPQKISQQHTRLGVTFNALAVEGEANAVPLSGIQTRHCRAPLMVASPIRRTSSRR